MLKNKLTHEEIRRLFTSGVQLSVIAAEAGVTHQRVAQILNGMGLSRSDGGCALVARQKRARREIERNLRCLQLWGITRTHYWQIRRRYGRAPFLAYHNHRYNSRRRNIAFKFTFVQWWAMWEPHWERRGRQGDRLELVMARHGDVGAYELGNVSITSHSNNMIEWHAIRGHAVV